MGSQNLAEKKNQVIQEILLLEDEQLLEEVRCLLLKDSEVSYQIPDVHIKLLLEDEEKYLKGESKTYTLSEVSKKIEILRNEIHS